MCSKLWLVLAVILLTGCQPNLNTMAYHSRSAKITVLIDDNLNNERTQLVIKAIEAWEYASNYSIDIMPIPKQPRPGLLINKFKRKRGEGAYLWYLSKNDQINLPKQNLDKFVGFFIPGTDGSIVFNQELNFNKMLKNKSKYIKNTGSIIIFHTNDDMKFYKVVLHELGHMLMLKHSDSQSSIMYKSMNKTDCITELDAKKLCKIYGCRPNTECIDSIKLFK